MALRVLYEADITGDDPREVLALAFGRFRFTPEGRRHAERLVGDFRARVTEVDRALSACLRHWELGRLGAVDRALLRVGAVELLYLQEVPTAVVLDEALRLAHRYLDPPGAAFVNGVLDALAREARRTGDDAAEAGGGSA